MDLSTYVRRDISGIRRDLLPLSGFGLLSHALSEEIAARNLASEGFYRSAEMEFLTEAEPEAAPEPRPAPRRAEPLRLDLTLLLKLVQQSGQPPLTAGSEKLLERVRTILVTDAGKRPVSGPASRTASRPAVRQLQTMELELRGGAGGRMRSPLRDPRVPITLARQENAPREVARASDHAMRFADVLRRAQGEGLTFATVKGGVPRSAQTRTAYQNAQQTRIRPAQAGEERDGRPVWQRHSPKEGSNAREQTQNFPRQEAERQMPSRNGLPESPFAPRYAETELQLAQDTPLTEAAAHPTEPRFARDAAQSLRDAAAVLTESAAAALREIHSESPAAQSPAAQKDASQKLQTQSVGLVENAAPSPMRQKAEPWQAPAQPPLESTGTMANKAKESPLQKEDAGERSIPEKQDSPKLERPAENELPRRSALRVDRSFSAAETASAETLFAPRYAETELQLAQDTLPTQDAAHSAEPRFAREAAQSLREAAAVLTESTAAALREIHSELPAAQSPAEQKDASQKLQTQSVGLVENAAPSPMRQKAEPWQAPAQPPLESTGTMANKAKESPLQKEDAGERSIPEKQDSPKLERPAENELPRRSALRGDRSFSAAETASAETLFAPRYAETELQLAQDTPLTEAAAHPTEPRFARDAAQSLRDAAAVLTESAAAALRETVPELTRAAVQATVQNQEYPTKKDRLTAGLLSAQIQLPPRESSSRQQTVPEKDFASISVPEQRPAASTAERPALMRSAESKNADVLFSPLRGEASLSELEGLQAVEWPPAPGYGKTVLEHRTEGPSPMEKDVPVTGRRGDAEPSALLWLGQKIAGNAARELAKMQVVSAGRRSLSGAVLPQQQPSVFRTELPLSIGQPLRSFGMVHPMQPGVSGTAVARRGESPAELIYISPEQSTEASSAAAGAEGLVRTLDRLLRTHKSMRPRELRTLSRKIEQNSRAQREMGHLSKPVQIPHPAELPELRYQTGRPELETMLPARGSVRPAGAEDTLEAQQVYPALAMEYSSPLTRMEEQLQTAVARQMELSARPIGTQTGAGQYMAGKASPESIKTLDQMSPPPASGQVVWQNPYLRAAPSEMTYRQKKQPPEPPASAPRPQPLRVSDAELRRMADQVFRLVKDSIRQERRKMGL
ncbi:MAG: hypothetical protein ACI4JC_00295 [Faecalibacterium sp.]